MSAARRLVILVLAAIPSLLGGCATPKTLPPTFAIAPGGYDRAFDAAREILRSYRFEIDRVDAGAGVISTAPKQSAGLATPWDDEQSTTREEFEDLFNHQQRTVRITFEPADPPEGLPPGSPAPEAPLGETASLEDLRRYRGPLIGRVMVVIEREHRPGRRVETVSIASSTFTQDPALVPRGMAGSYWVPIAQDPLLAGRLAERIQETLGVTAPRKPPGPAGDG